MSEEQDVNLYAARRELELCQERYRKAIELLRWARDRVGTSVTPKNQAIKDAIDELLAKHPIVGE